LEVHILEKKHFLEDPRIWGPDPRKRPSRPSNHKISGNNLINMSISMLYMTKKSDKKWKKAILKGPPLGPQGESFYENSQEFRD